MADDSPRDALLPGSLDPPKRRLEKKSKKFFRSRSAPSIDHCSSIPVDEDHDRFPGSKLISGYLRPSFKTVALFLVIYLGAAALCFYLVKDQISGKKTNYGVLDALYFSIVTMTTVGYGDLVPKSTASKLLACAFAFTGMALVGMLLSRAADFLVEKQEVLLYKALHIREKGGQAHMMEQIETNKAKYKFYTAAVFLVLMIFIGTVFLWKVEKLNFVDAFYCVCSTITTLGYGDESFSTGEGRVFAVFWIVTSTICVAQFFLYLAAIYAERRQRRLAKWVLTRRMTYVDLEAADLDEDGAVGAAEFIIYKLKEMGKISEQDIALVMEEFEDLDVDRSGTLTAADLVLAQCDR